MVVINSYPRSHLIVWLWERTICEKNFVHARPISRFLYDLPLWSYILPLWDWSYDRWHDWRCDHRRLTRLLWDLLQDQSWWATTNRMPNVTSGSQSERFVRLVTRVFIVTRSSVINVSRFSAKSIVCRAFLLTDGLSPSSVSSFSCAALLLPTAPGSRRCSNII